MSFTRKIVDHLVFNDTDWSITHRDTDETLLKVDNLPYTRLAANTIQFLIPIPGIPTAQTGLAADSTGVKYEGFRFKIKTRHLKSAVLRATWTASHTDSETAIELYDVTADAVRGSVSGNTGTDTEASIDTSSLVDGNLHELRVNVTTASATSGATTDVTYAILELTYGIS